MVDNIQKMCYVYDQTWDHLTKIIWTSHKDRTKVNTDTDLKNLYNHLNMCLNAVTRLRGDLIPGYQSIKSHYEFSK